MKRAKRWLLFIPAAVLLLSLLASTDAALPFKKVSIAKTPASTTSTKTTTTTTETPETQETAASSDDDEQQVPPSGDGTENAKDDNVTISKNSKLTGIPQIDYIWDPNLPRELRGYNLSSYPFLSTVPPQDEIHFKCEGLHDGFYASIEYKCQIYHHCVYGIRHDFLCANFTAFDQRTFICHFASDVDCEGSQKYWNRNDELYMATTTTSTSTSTTEPPPTQPHRRRVPQRPQRRRPYDHRRPLDDYYYDEEDEQQQQYEDDYYEERFNRRQKTKRQRHRKPIKEVDYDDEYEDEKPAAAPPPPRRNRNRYRDEDEDPLDEDYDDRRGGSRRRKPASAGRKISARKPQAEGRRSFNEDRTPLLNRRRSNEKRLGSTTPSSLSSAALDDLDDYEKPYADVDQEEAAEEQTPQKIKTSTAKSLTEFITPKAAAASVYARPRAPPRIARPVPINEKKKYSYPVQKTNTATTTPKSDLDDDYYQQEAQQEGAADDEYDQPLPVRSTLAPSRRRPAGPTRNPLRKPVTEKKVALDDDYYEEPPTTRRKQQQQQARPQARTRAPPPSSAADVDFLDEDEPPIRGQRVRAKPAPRKSIPRPRQPIVEAEDIHADDKDEAEAPPSQRPRVNLLARRKQTRQRIEPEEPIKEQQQEQQPQHDDQEPVEELEPVKPSLRPSAVRVVKRPFLPSRGGSPYLPRGLQPVGVALKPSSSPAPPTTQSTPIDMGSTISGVRLLEHGAPLLRSQNNNNNDDDIDVAADDDDDDDDAADRIINERRKQPAPLSRTTLPPRSALPPATPKRNQEQQRPKLNLDELYENDYDVTLNDALDPTLKPLSTHSHSHTHSHPHQHPQQQQQQQQQLQYRPYASAYNNPFAYQPQQQPQSQSQAQAQPQQSLSSLSASSSPAAGGYHSDSYFSSTDIRRRAIVGPSPQGTRSHRHEYPAAGGSAAAVRVAQHFYDDFAY
ncbi:DNA translocase FtsK [Drosophila tropicalis]|uniref:DNA translocase FtsK n=1 Tax=Drosophila tropicalis TaxID=46794 RepID=UPI0035AB99E5